LPLIPLTYQNSSSYHSVSQPSPDILFQAITRRSTDENLDMENLEILGDCFLKLTVSMSLYHRYSLAGAGALTVEKGKQISNGNLYRIAAQKKLKPYLNAMKINFRGEDANWIPPGYIINKTQQTEINNELELKRYQYQKVKRKGFADMMEGIMGAFLIATDYTTTMQFMKWLGLDVLPLDENGKKYYFRIFVLFFSIELDQIIEIPSILCPYIKVGEIDPILNKFYNDQAFYDIERKINYNFRNKAYLIAAFTHPSSFANRLTNCYER
jgi:dsRNA-specific ribonuclease